MTTSTTERNRTTEEQAALRAELRDKAEEMRVTAANCKDELIQRAFYALAKVADMFARGPK